MELFDKKYVYFMWDDELEGKRCFTSNDINKLVDYVNNNDNLAIDTINTGNSEYPFSANCIPVRFAYYDPNYDVKWGYYRKNKKVQAKLKGFPEAKWKNIKCPKWESSYEWRIQPEEEIVQSTDNLPQANLENYINSFPSVINPCKLCAFIDANGESHFDNTEECKHCCWYYGSNFKAQ